MDYQESKIVDSCLFRILDGQEILESISPSYPGKWNKGHEDLWEILQGLLDDLNRLEMDEGYLIDVEKLEVSKFSEEVSEFSEEVSEDPEIKANN